MALADNPDMDETILLGIDGTGDLSDALYQHEMRNSFVSYILRHTPAIAKKYMRGPGFDGLDMGMLIAEGYTFVHLQKVVRPKAKVLLVGYSRGGAGVIGVAMRLARDKVPVAGMVLFDPVDRSPTSEANEIPTNVARVYQVRRIPDTFSRVSFNNCGRVVNPSTTEAERDLVWGTHGAMGGVPWHAASGQRPNDYVSEGESELTLMRATYQLAGIGWVPEAGDHRTQDQFLAERFAFGDHTRVTFRQDAAASRRVWELAKPNLVRWGFLRN